MAINIEVFQQRLQELTEERIELERDKGNLSFNRKKLAAEIGIAYPTLSKYYPLDPERANSASKIAKAQGSRFPSMDSAALLADYFDVSVDYLIGRTTARKYDEADLATLCDYSGLSQEAVLALSTLKNMDTMGETINYLLENAIQSVGTRSMSKLREELHEELRKEEQNNLNLDEHEKPKRILPPKSNKDRSIPEELRKRYILHQYGDMLKGKMEASVNGTSVVALIDAFFHLSPNPDHVYLVSEKGVIQDYELLSSEKINPPQLAMDGVKIAQDYILSRLQETLIQAKKEDKSDK